MIPDAKHLHIEGDTNLVVPITLNGGAFTVGNISNANLLDFQRGTFRMTTADLTVGTAGQFGPTLELASGQHVVIDNDAHLDSEGLLPIGSGASFTADAINNDGEIALAGTTARLARGTVQNTGLLRGDGRIDSAVTNATGGEVRVGAAQRLVFTSAALVNQGQVNVTGGTLDLRQGASNTGSINLAGGAADVYGNINIPVGGRVSVGGSTQANFFGNITQNGVVSIAPGSTASFFGNVSGSGTFAMAGSAEFLGAISPGNSPGVMNVTGSATLYNTATLLIELAGTTAGTQYDQLHATGPLALNGTLSVSLISGYTPQAGNSFDILDWGTLAGTFDSIQLPALTAGLQWNTSQLYTTGVLSVAAPGLLGDYNGNNSVDAADYVVWRKGGPLANEVDTPGTVNAADYTAWRARFGNSGSGAGANENAVVPEPATTVLLMLAAAGCCLRRGRDA